MKAFLRNPCFAAPVRRRRQAPCTLGLCAVLAWAPVALGLDALGIARHKVQVSGAEATDEVVRQGGKLIADYGAYGLYGLPELPATLATRPGIEVRDEYNEIQLNAGKLDTARPEVQAMRQRTSAFTGKRLHLVQFAGPVQPAWHAGLIAAGLQVVTYVPQNAYLVYGDAAAISSLQSAAAGLSYLQWEGAYQDQYKLHPELRPADEQGNPRQLPTKEVAVQLVADPEANAATLALLDARKLEPFRERSAVLNYENVVVSLAPADLQAIAARPDVVSIAPYYLPEKYCERQDQIIAGNLTGNAPSGPGYLAWLASKGFTQAQFTDSAFGADVTDSGVDNATTSPNHPGLRVGGLAANASRVIYNRLEGNPNGGSTLKGCDGHGNLNAHVIGGYNDLNGFPHTDAAGYHYGLGVCPFVKVGSSVIFDFGFTSPNFANLQSRAYRDGARVSNNSWGGGNNGGYSISSQAYDALVRDAQPANAAVPAPGNQEMVIVFAAGNSGPGARTIGAPGTGKNVFTIGAAENVQLFGGNLNGNDGCLTPDNEANSANDIVSFSARGPCTDGRIKPDLMAPGSHVSGGVAQAANPGPNGSADPCFSAQGVCGGLLTNTIFLGFEHFYPTGQQFFTASSGTSHAAPAVVGGCALLRQYFINHGLTPPSPAMTKGYLMNSARYMNGTGANDNLYSNNQGMGELFLGLAFDGVTRILRDQLPADLFTASGQTRTFFLAVTDTNKPLRVTLAWTDAPGNTTGGAFNNNLDLTLSAGATIYRGNVFTNGSSVPGGTADTRNNVESIFLPAQSGSLFTLTITATSINSDGVPNNGTPLDQDFALVVYNASLPAPPVINSIQPTNLMALVGQPASFSLSVTGTPPLSIQWRLNGVNLAGATASSYSIASVAPAHAGAYSAVLSSPYGSATSAPANLIIISSVPLPFALNNSNLTWTTDAGTPWFGQTNLSHDGTAAGQIWPILANQQTSLRTTVNGPGTLSFWWKVSSADNADTLKFRSNGIEKAAIAGQSDWSQQLMFLSAGSQNLEWTYLKGTNSTPGQDGAWVDEVVGVVPLIAVGDESFGQTSPGAAGSSAIAIAAGAWHSLALHADGTVGAWGFNYDGECDVPAGLAGAVGIAAGGYHSLALRANQRVVGWGANFYGEASPPATLSNVIAIAAGTWHSLALLADRTVVGWGDNSAGQIGVPANLSNVIAIAAGGNHSLALRSDGVVVAWGENTDSQGGFAGQSIVPEGLAGVIAIAAGEYHSLAVRANGSVVAWGENSEGQSTPPAGLTGVVAVAGGSSHSLALRANGTIAAWGANWSGQCGFPPGLAYAIAISAGSAHSLVLLGDSAAPPRLINPIRYNNQFSVQVQTFAGKTYSLEYKNSLTDVDWVTTLAAIPGNGTLQTLLDPDASAAQRIYRVRVR